MRTRIIFALSFLIALSACASSDDDAKWLAEQRAIISPINGGFTFKQYVIVSSGDKEVLGSEGVFYISPKMFTDEQLANITRSEPGKHLIYGDEATAYFHLFNTCFSAKPVSAGKAGDAARYLSLVLTSAGAPKDKKGIIRFRLYSWPDFWYDWVIHQSDDGFTVDDGHAEQGWGWSNSRVVITRDPSVTLDACLYYRNR